MEVICPWWWQTTTFANERIWEIEAPHMAGKWAICIWGMCLLYVYVCVARSELHCTDSPDAVPVSDPPKIHYFCRIWLASSDIFREPEQHRFLGCYEELTSFSNLKTIGCSQGFLHSSRKRKKRGKSENCLCAFWPKKNGVKITKIFFGLGETLYGLRRLTY